jgi:hypothetical protein
MVLALREWVSVAICALLTVGSLQAQMPSADSVAGTVDINSPSLDARVESLRV